MNKEIRIVFWRQNKLLNRGTLDTLRVVATVGAVS